MAGRTKGGKTYSKDPYRRILSALGVYGEFMRSFPRHARQDIMQHGYPKPMVVLDPSIKDEKPARKIKNELERTLSQIVFEAEPLNSLCSLQDYFTAGLSLAHGFRDGCVPDNLSEDMERIKQATQRLLETEVVKHACVTLISNLENVLVMHNRIDTLLYWITCESKEGRGGAPIHTITLYRQVPPQISVEVEGRPRPAYRCGQCYTAEIGWVELNGECLGKSHEGKQ